jgi:tetratricopeptide (TPR) repeat protein
VAPSARQWQKAAYYVAQADLGRPMAIIILIVILGISAAAGIIFWKQRVKRMLRRASILQRNKDYNEALRILNNVVKISPSHPEVYSDRAKLRYLMGENNAAIADFIKAAELTPNDAGIYNSLGLARLGIKEYAEAIEDFGRAISRRRNYAEAYFNRAATLAKIGQYKRCRCRLYTCHCRKFRLCRSIF